jgi:phosphatidylserine/phosphatidylglycerophosphate/cardiolipin synthase-like enzyme
MVKIYAKVHFPFVSYASGFRTHRKAVVIDGLVVHLGGLNIGDEYGHFSKKYGY